MVAALVLELPEDAWVPGPPGRVLDGPHQPPSVLCLAWALSWTLGDLGYFRLRMVLGNGDAAQPVWCWCGQEAS